MENIIERIHNYSLEEIMGDRFARYAKTIIQDRAIPDVRDGLKPVQRRILYSMYKDRNTYEKPTRKCAKTVGNVMGNFHPHGDSSIYEAMVRMSQWWKQNTPYIFIQGNNGSMDGDPAAASRYTEAKLAKISNELLKDIDKGTVSWAPNYDDTELEPTVLPAKFPNLLVNGANGISAGYATNIPPHNLGEVIDATIKRITSPNCKLETILEIVKGPDFPTGGIVEGKSGIIDAFKTGRGKVIVRSKTIFQKEKSKEQIVITEIPFDVNKALLVKKIDDIRIDKKIEGISEVRDESDKEGLRIVIDLKSGANKDIILNYLLKNTDLQISFNYNNVAIVNRRPMTLGIIEILDAYISYQREFITKRTEFDLEHAKLRMEIVEGLIKALSILDDVIKTIRSSKIKQDSIVNLVNKYEFSERQADEIFSLQLYRLTNTDVEDLNKEHTTLEIIIKGLEKILSDEDELKKVMIDELKKVKNEYATPRKTEIRDEITDIKIDTLEMIPKEDCIVVVTNEGYIKRVSLRSYNASENTDTLVKEGDYVIGTFNVNTMDTVLLFTDLGNYLYIPVYQIPDLKWKDLGKHISNIIKINEDENIVFSYPIYNFDEENYITIFTKNGMVKRTSLSEFKAQRYSKPITSIKLKGDDKVISVHIGNEEEVFISTRNGYGLRYKASEIPVTGLKSSGVKAITLKNDYVVSAHLFDQMDYLVVLTTKNTGKRIKINEFETTSRARRGIQLVREVKTNPYYILKTLLISSKINIGLKTKDDIVIIKTTDLPITDRYSTGSVLSKTDILDVFTYNDVISKDMVKEVIKEEVSLEKIDERIMTIDDFLDDFKIN